MPVLRFLLSALLVLQLAYAAPLLSQSQTVPRQPAPAPTAAAAPAPASTLPNEKDSVKFLVIGDSGTGDRWQNEWPFGTGAVARLAGESPHCAGHGESHLAVALRDGAHAESVEFRTSSRSADPP